MSLLLESPPPSSLLPVARDRPSEVSRPQQDVPFAPVEPPPETPSNQPFWIEATNDIAVLERYRAAWQDLADHTIEPNPFYEPWMFLPAWRAFGHEAAGTTFVLVWQRDPRPKQPATLVGFAPLTPRRGFGGVPVKYRRVWQHAYCYLCAPLLRRGVERDALKTVLDWMAAKRLGPLELHHVPAEGLLNQALVDATNDLGASLFLVERYNRALLRPMASAEDYTAASMTNHNRQELRRQRRRLGELGRYEVRSLAAVDGSANNNTVDVDGWIQTFLDLERLGWKGQEETALGCDPVTQNYFETICREAHARGQLMMLGLFLDGRPIAAKCNFLSGDGGYAFKIGFDESFSKYSPGVQLEVENVRLVHERPSLRWLDSCAIANHPMINRVWAERRTIQKVLVSPGRWRDNIAVDAIAAMSGLRKALRRRK